MTNKEKLLEKKVSILERRLVLIERFVELRFCETFRDFTIRNNSGKPSEPGNGANAEEEPPAASDDECENHARESISKSSRPTRQSSNKPGPASSKKSSSTGHDTRLKDCVVRVVRTQGIDTCGENRAFKDVSSKAICDSPGSRRYGTRRQTRISEQRVVIRVKSEVNTEDENTRSSSLLELEHERNVTDGEDYGIAAVEGSLYGNDGDGDEYITYPADRNNESVGITGQEHDNQMESENAEQDEDGNWSEGDNAGGEDDSDDADFQVEQAENKGKQIKRKMQSSLSRKKKRVCEPKKKNHIYYLASMSDLSRDAKIVSTDSSRAECPVCKQYWKVEFIEQHIASHTKERHLKCPHCDKSYFKTDDLRSHMKMKHNREKYYPKCRLCNEPIVRKMILHERYCVKKALQKGERVDKSLVEDIRQQCAKAGLEFSTPDETVPPGLDPSEKIECPHCERYFQRRYYDQHVKTHSLARNWKCSKCPKAYIHKHDLIRHMCITHEASLKCELCGETCESRVHLRTHKLKCRNSKGLTPRPKVPFIKARKAVESPKNSTVNDEVPGSSSNDQPATEINASTQQFTDMGESETTITTEGVQEEVLHE